MDNKIRICYYLGQGFDKKILAIENQFQKGVKEMFGKYIFVFFISMVPLIKPRGALPYSQTFRLPLVSSYIIAIIGNMLPVPIIYLFAHKVLEWGKDKPYIGKFSHSVLKKGKRADRS